MIEALIAYIEDQGFEVHVFPGVLCVRKVVYGKLWGIDWMISRLDLEMARTCEVLLFREADYRLAALRKAIEEKQREGAALQVYHRVEQRYSEANRKLAEND